MDELSHAREPEAAGVEPASSGNIDAIETIVKAMMKALTQRLGTDFACEVKELIELEAKALEESSHPDDQRDAKFVWLVAQGKLFRDLGV